MEFRYVTVSLTVTNRPYANLFIRLSPLRPLSFLFAMLGIYLILRYLSLGSSIPPSQKRNSRADCILRQHCLTTFLKWSSFSRFPCSPCQPYRCRIPSVIHFNYGCILRFSHIQFHVLMAIA